MVKLTFPPPDFKIRKEESAEVIFDALRRRWVRLTPEEWVRQNMIQYLVQVAQYPSVLVGVEKEIRLGDLRKRFDILVYDADHQPWLMVECKSMEVALNDEVLQQALRYNLAVPVAYLVITNGVYTFVYKKEAGGLQLLEQLPVHNSR